MKVRATQTGYYNHVRYYEGDVFELVPIQGHTKAFHTGKLSPITSTPEQQFAPSWMEKVEDEKGTFIPPKPPKTQQELLPPGMKARSTANPRIATPDNPVARTAGRGRARPIESKKAEK